MPTVLVVAPTSSYRTSDFVAAARRLDIDLAVASEDDPPIDLGDRFVRIDLGDPAGSAAAIVRLADRTPIDAVVAVDDAGVEMAALASAELGLPHHTPEAAASTRDKLAMRRRLAGGEVPQPGFAVLGDDPVADAAGLSYPLVVKPRTGTASRGVLKVDRPEDLPEVVGRVTDIAAAAGEEGPLLAEEYLPGDEFALEGLLIGGDLAVLAIFDKPDAPSGPTFEETILVTPSSLDRDGRAELERVVSAAVRALGLAHGPIHAEARRDDAGHVRVIEVAARSIGGLCGRALRFGLTGSRLEEIILAVALGQPVVTTRVSTATGILMLPVPAEGELVAVTGVEEALASEGITDVVVTVSPGTYVRPLPHGDRYLGFVFATGPDPGTVGGRLRRAGDLLEASITPPAADRSERDGRSGCS